MVSKLRCQTFEERAMSIPASSLPFKYQAQLAAQMNANAHPLVAGSLTSKPKPRIRQNAEPLEGAFFAACDIPVPVYEYRFHSTRKWRFDYAWPDKKLALEVEGGVWTQGRHTRGSGFVGDMEKYNAAATMGWRILRVQPCDIKNAGTMAMILDALNPDLTPPKKVKL